MKIKKFFSFALAVALIAGFVTIPAFAANTITGVALAENGANIDVTVTFDTVSSAGNTVSVCLATSAPANVAAMPADKQTQSSVVGTTTYTFSFPKPTQPGTYKAYADYREDGIEASAETYVVSEPADPSDPAAFDHGIDYSGTADYDLIPTAENGSVPAGMKLDLAAEKLYVPDGTEIKAYSLDGGGKWTAKPLGKADGESIEKLLNKGCTLWLTNSYDAKAKKPTVAKAAEGENPAVPAATVFKFVPIAARPKLDKLAINYAIVPDNSGKTAGAWVLTVKDGAAAVKDQKGIALQVAPADETKKNPQPNADGKLWGVFPATGGINVKPLGEDGKVAKTVYLVRSAPVATGTVTPASKATKFTALGLQKETKFKADYKKENLKLKENVVVFFGNAAALKVSSATAANYSATATTDPAGSLTTLFGKEAAKTGLNLAPYLKEEVTALCFFTAATSKKPASSIQEYNLAARAYLENSVLAPEKGKVKVDTKLYEMLNTEKGKWGGLPKLTAAAQIPLRLKATAKGGKEDQGGFAASRDGKLSIGWGKYDPAAKTPKDGVVSAEIVAPNYAGVLNFRPKAASETVKYSYVYGQTPDPIVFDVTGLIAAADLSDTDLEVVVEPADIIQTDSVTYDSATKTVTVEVDSVLSTGAVTVSLKVKDAFFTSNADYLKDLTYCKPAVLTVSPVTVELPTPSGTATVADLTAPVSYVFTFSDATVKALLANDAADGKIAVTASALTGATVAAVADISAGTITVTVTPTESNTSAQKLTLTLTVGKDVKTVVLGSKASYEVSISKITKT